MVWLVHQSKTPDENTNGSIGIHFVRLGVSPVFGLHRILKEHRLMLLDQKR